MEEHLIGADPIEALLARATVRVSGARKGSGFFVAAGKILSCAHVVGRDCKPGDRMTITRLDASTAEAELEAIDAATDVALLRTKAQTVDAIVTLDDDALLGDAMLLYGWPEGMVTARTATYEGGEGPPGASRIKHLIKGAQVIGGLSGGPLLNLRTLAVIGVMAQTRDDRFDLGGYAVPVGRLRAVLPALGTLIDTQGVAVRDAWRAAREERHRRISQRLDEVAGVKTALPGAAAIASFIARYRQMSFAGRHREFATLDAWIDAPDAAPYRLITAPAGRGKSALLVHWIAGLAARSEVLRLVFVPISLRDQLTGEADVLSALAARLAATWSIPAPVFGANPLTLRDFIAGTLARPLPDGVRAVVVVDALDEAAGWNVSRTLLPHPPATGVRILLTARSTAEHDSAGWRARLGLDSEALCSTHALDNLMRDDLALLVRHTWPHRVSESETLMDALLAASDGGDPLVVQLFAETFANDPAKLLANVGDRAVIKRGLDRFFEHWWADQEQGWGQRFARLEPAARIVFNVLAFTLAPIGRRALLALTRQLDATIDGDVLDEALALLGRFIVRSDNEYVLAHPRFAEHRRLRLEHDGDSARYQDAFRAWATVSLANNAQLESYLVRNWALHLEALNAPPEAFRVFCTRQWQRAWDEVGDDEAGLLRDLQLASKRFRDVARCLGDAWVAAFRIAERRNLLMRLDPQTAAPLLQHGLWSARRALSLVAAWRGDAARAQALALLIPMLPTHLLRDAERVLSALGTYDKHHLAPAWMALVRRVDATDGRRAASVLANNRPPGAVRAGVLLALAAATDDIVERSRLAAQAASEQPAMNSIEQRAFASLIVAAFGAHRIGDRIDTQAQHVAQTASLAVHSRRGPLQDLLHDQRPQAIITALTYALPWTTSNEAHGLIAHALAMLTDHPSPVLQSQLLTELAPYVAADQVDAVLTALAASGDSPLDQDDRLHVLAALAPSMTPHQRAQHHSALGAFASRLAPHSDELQHLASLRALIDAGFGATIEAATLHALSTGHFSEPALSLVVERLDESRTRLALTTLYEHHRGGSETPQGAMRALTLRLAAFGREQALEALNALERVDATLLRRGAAIGIGMRIGLVGHFSELLVDLLDAVSRPASRPRAWTLRCFAMGRMSLGEDEADLFLRSAADEEARAFILRHTEPRSRDLHQVRLQLAGESEQADSARWDQRGLQFDDPDWLDELMADSDLGTALFLYGAKIATHLRSLPRAEAEAIGATIFAPLPRDGRLKAQAVGDLAFVMPMAAATTLDATAIGGNSSTDRTTAFAALGARLVVLGAHAQGMELLRKATYSDGVATHLADAVRWAPEAALVDLAKHAFERLGNANDDVALEPLAERWEEIAEATAGPLLSAWLEAIPADSLPSVFAQLPNFIGGIERLGGRDALQAIAEVL